MVSAFILFSLWIDAFYSKSILLAILVLNSKRFGGFTLLVLLTQRLLFPFLPPDSVLNHIFPFQERLFLMQLTSRIKKVVTQLSPFGNEIAVNMNQDYLINLAIIIK